MHALVYTGTQQLVYRELKDGSRAFKEIHNGTCSAPKIILLI